MESEHPFTTYADNTSIRLKPDKGKLFYPVIKDSLFDSPGADTIEFHSVEAGTTLKDLIESKESAPEIFIPKCLGLMFRKSNGVIKVSRLPAEGFIEE